MPREFGPITQQTRAAIEANHKGISAHLTTSIVENLAEAYLSEQKMGATDHPVASHEPQTQSALERLHTETYRRELLGLTIPIVSYSGNVVVWKGQHPTLSECGKHETNVYTVGESSNENPDLFLIKGSMGGTDCAASMPIRKIYVSRKEIKRTIKTQEMLSDLEHKTGISFRKSILEGQS